MSGTSGPTGNAPGAAIGDAEKGIAGQTMHAAYPSRDDESKIDIKDVDGGSQQLPQPSTAAKDSPKPALHPAFYVM